MLIIELQRCTDRLASPAPTFQPLCYIKLSSLTFDGSFIIIAGRLSFTSNSGWEGEKELFPLRNSVECLLKMLVFMNSTQINILDLIAAVERKKCDLL